MYWDGDPLMWHYIGEKYVLYKANGTLGWHFSYWPPNLFGKFPMKGPKMILGEQKPFSELFLLRTSLVYMILGTNWNNDDISFGEWKFTGLEGPYIGAIEGNSKVYSRIMLPGNYTLSNQAFYLLADSGKLYSIQQMKVIHNLK